MWQDVELSTESGLALSHSLEGVEATVRRSRPDGDYVSQLVRMLCTRCMLQAVYFASGYQPPREFHHYGLAANIYTHFTSPIRRYE